jgi:hypothetical protein
MGAGGGGGGGAGAGGMGGHMGAGSISGIGTYGQHRGPRTMHTPPQTPPYHGTLNGHSAALGSHVAYGVTPGTAAATLGGHGHGHHLPHAHAHAHQKPMSNLGTLGRNPPQHSA